MRYVMGLILIGLLAAGCQGQGNRTTDKPSYNEPGPASPKLSQQQGLELYKAFMDYWKARITSHWKMTYRYETIQDNLTPEQYIRNALQDEWVLRMGPQLWKFDPFVPQTNNVYTITAIITDQAARPLITIKDNWKLRHGVWYHMPDEFVRQIMALVSDQLPENTN